MLGSGGPSAHGGIAGPEICFTRNTEALPDPDRTGSTLAPESSCRQDLGSRSRDPIRGSPAASLFDQEKTPMDEPPGFKPAGIGGQGAGVTD